MANRTGLFGGSFDPFTIGHSDIVSRALGIFDRVVICIGVNASKCKTHSQFGTPDERAADIARYYASDPRVEVMVTTDLITQAAESVGATTLIRAVRSVKDYEYERDMAAVNRLVSGLDTIIFPASASLEAVSSSVVRELYTYNNDITRFLPENFIISSINRKR